MSVHFPKGVTLWPIAKLSTYFRNPRKHTQEQVHTLAKLIKKYGWTDPIIVDETQGILAGHLRYATALHMNLTEVPVVEITHLSDAEKKAFVIAHNQIALKSSWDNVLLADEIAAIREADMDMSLTALTESELANLERVITDSLTDIVSPAYEPSVSPLASTREVTDDDVEEASDRQENQFKHNPFLRQVVCPHCGEEYYLDGEALKLPKGTDV